MTGPKTPRILLIHFPLWHTGLATRQPSKSPTEILYREKSRRPWRDSRYADSGQCAVQTRPHQAPAAAEQAARGISPHE